jgi:chemotaxis protein MotB
MILKNLLILLFLHFLVHGIFAQENNKAPKEEVKEPLFFYWKSEVTDASKLKAEKEALEKQYVELKAKYENDTRALRDENEKLKADLRRLEQEKSDRVSSRSVTVSDSETKIANLERELIETRRQKDQLERDLASKTFAERQAQDRIRTLEATINSNNYKSSNIQSGISSSEAPFSYSTTSVKSESNEDLRAQIASLTNQRDQLQRDLAATYSYIDSLKKESGAKTVDPVSTIENNKVTSTTTTSSFADSNSKVQELQSRLSQVISERDSLQNQVSFLRNQQPTTTSVTNNSTTVVTDKDKRIQDLEAQVNSLTNQRDQLQRDIAAIYGYQKSVVIGNSANPTTTIANNDELLAKVNRLEFELAEMTKKRDKLQKDLDASYQTVYNSSKNPYSTTTITTVTTIEEARIKLAELEKQNQDLTNERNQLKIDLANSVKDKSLSSQVTSTTTTVTTVETEKSEAEKAKEQAAKDAAKEIAKIEEAKKAKEAQITANDKELVNKKSSVEELRKEIETLTKELQELKEDKETLETDLAATKEMHQEESLKSKEEIERLTLQSQKLEEALEKELKKKKSKTITPSSKTTTTSVTEENSNEVAPARISSKMGKTIISLASKVNFKTNSSELTPKGKDTLNKVLNVLRKYSTDRIYVEGNTDNRPIQEGSKFRDNWHLSFERALTVLKYLNKDKALKSTKFAAAAYAEKNPVKPNNSDMNRAANRRVDIVVVPKK